MVIMASRYVSFVVDRALSAPLQRQIYDQCISWGRSN